MLRTFSSDSSQRDSVLRTFSSRPSVEPVSRGIHSDNKPSSLLEIPPDYTPPSLLEIPPDYTPPSSPPLLPTSKCFPFRMSKSSLLSLSMASKTHLPSIGTADFIYVNSPRDYPRTAHQHYMKPPLDYNTDIPQSLKAHPSTPLAYNPYTSVGLLSRNYPWPPKDYEGAPHLDYSGSRGHLAGSPSMSTQGYPIAPHLDYSVSREHLPGSPSPHLDYSVSRGHLTGSPSMSTQDFPKSSTPPPHLDHSVSREHLPGSPSMSTQDYPIASTPSMSMQDYPIASTPPPEIVSINDSTDSDFSYQSIDYPPPPPESEVTFASNMTRASNMMIPTSMTTSSNMMVSSNVAITSNMTPASNMAVNTKVATISKIMRSSNKSLSTISSEQSHQEDDRTEADQKICANSFQRERKLSHYENLPLPLDLGSPYVSPPLDLGSPYYFPDPPEEVTLPRALEPPTYRTRTLNGHYSGVTKSFINSEVTQRDHWGSHCQYFLTTLGLVIGLGNLWRFPYICFDNGGSTFLIPYVLMLFLVGLPLLLLEMAVGQYAGISATKIFARLAPGVKGLGYGMLAIPIVVNFYYTVIMAWSFFFMFSGFTEDLPWKTCGKEYNSESCFSLEDSLGCPMKTTFWNNTCTPVHDFCTIHGLRSDDLNDSHCLHPNSSLPIQTANLGKRVSAAEDFFLKRMLGIGQIGVESSWANFGSLRWELVGCLALSWTIICLCLIKGIHSYGKVVYFITLLPIGILITLLIYTSFHDGFAKGVEFYIMNPDWSRLKSDISVWKNAAVQVFYSLGVSTGEQLLLSSYNNFNSNCHRDAILIAVCNSIASIFGGFVVFGTLGILAHKNQIEIQDVVTSGTSLVFVAYPEAIAHLQVAPFFSFIFFLMLCLLALSSIAAGVETTIAAVLDEFPMLRAYRPLVVVSGCVISFLGGLSCCCNSGFLMFTLLDQRCSQSIIIIGLFEIVVLYFYGNNRLIDNMKEMKIWMPRPMRWYWKLCWGFLTPTLLITILILSWMAKEEDHYGDYTYPPLIQLLGWMIELFPLVIVLVVSVYVVVYNLAKERDTSFIQAGPLLSPTLAWVPREDRHQDLGRINMSPTLAWGSREEDRAEDLGRINLSYYLDGHPTEDIKTEL